MRPGLAGVGGFVDAVADGEIRAVQALAAANVNDVGIRGRDGNRADGAGGLVVKDRLPGPSVIVGLPHTAVADTYIEDAGLRRHPADGATASATVRTDAPPFEGGEQRGIKLGERAGLRLGYAVCGVAVVIGSALWRELRLGSGGSHFDFGGGGGLLGECWDDDCSDYECTDA